MDVDPYKMLNVPKNFTPDQLKAAYKKLALVMHPDKQGGNDYMFKMLTSCYKQLVREYNSRISDRQFTELKTASQNYARNPGLQANPMNGGGGGGGGGFDKKNFNINKFNKVFEENSLPDGVKEVGYDDWLKTGDAGKEPTKMKGKFSLSAFNNQFEKNVQGDASKHLVKYKEPEPLFTGKKIQFTELGVDKIDDFSGDNMTKKNLNYMDLKLAHTTSRIVDPSTVKERKMFNSVDDVKADRANVSYTMSEKDMRYYQQKKKLEELREKQRMMKLTEQDKLSLEHFERVNRLMLGDR